MKKNPTFENNMEQLENILKKMQDDSTGLEESVSLYRDAAALIQECSQTLSAAKVQIEEISVKMQGVEDTYAE